MDAATNQEMRKIGSKHQKQPAERGKTQNTSPSEPFEGTSPADTLTADFQLQSPGTTALQFESPCLWFFALGALAQVPDLCLSHVFPRFSAE